MLTNTDLILRLLLAAGLGGSIGLERERAHKVAGLRTHALVALGAALLSLISIYLFEAHPSVNGVSGFDYHIPVPNTGETSAIANIIPLQLLAYYMSVELGNNVDKPRNIAKSVTVK